MPIYFFDTSALKHRYVTTAQRRRIRKITSNLKGTCYICDWTIVEIASALGGHCRGNKLNVAKFDRMDREFFQDLAAGRILVRRTTSRGMLQARSILRKGVMLHRDVDSGDALIAACCRELALELKQRVAFYTADWGLYTLLRGMDSFTAVMTLRYILTPKNGIPAET
jgi:predicted nucleic acid-binding protein